MAILGTTYLMSGGVSLYPAVFSLVTLVSGHWDLYWEDTTSYSLLPECLL